MLRTGATEPPRQGQAAREEFTLVGIESRDQVLKTAERLKRITENRPLDYVFKARVTGWLGRGEDLLRFFAWFYTATGILAFGLQTGFARRALRRLGGKGDRRPARRIGRGT